MGQEKLTDMPVAGDTDPEAKHPKANGDPQETENCVDSPENSISAGGDTSDDSDAGNDYTSDDSDRVSGDPLLLCLTSHLPPPIAPPGLTKQPSPPPEDGPGGTHASSIGKYIREQGSSFSAAILKRISSLKESEAETVTEIRLSGVKVIVRSMDEERSRSTTDGWDLSSIKGQISFFSRSNCRDCGAVRSFLREKGIRYIEINVDVFPEREEELAARTGGSSAVPALFFNEKLVGGLAELNAMRKDGEFEKRVREMAWSRCHDLDLGPPSAPVYGFDGEEEMEMGMSRDEMVGVVRVVRQRVPIGDRIVRMKVARNCFAGSDLVEAIIHHLDCGRKKAVEIGKELARKHFIHHVFREKDFEDEHNQFYRFLEHDPVIPKCFNFRGTTNDTEPKPAREVSQRITKLMFAVLETYASDDRRRLDYARIASSEEFRRYVNLVQDLQRADVFSLSKDERTAFFLNLYNAMVIHAIIRAGRPRVVDKSGFFSDFHYVVGGYPYSLSTIKNGILRSNQRQPYSFTKPLAAGDRRLKLALPKVNPLIHFGLCDGTRSSPMVRFFSAEGIEVELRQATREFFLHGGMEVDLDKRTIYLTKIIKWYNVDFGEEKDILKWILNYLDPRKAGLLTHLMSDGGATNIAYQNFDSSLNC